MHHQKNADKSDSRASAHRSRRKLVATLLFTVILAALVYTQLTIFIIPPIGAVPDGKTLVILRLNKTKFIDSPDAMCERFQGGVSLLCRGTAMAAVIKTTKIIARLPYSETLYLISTDGKQYSR